VLAVCPEQNPNFLPNESRRMKPPRRRSLPLATPQKNTLCSFHFARPISFSPNEKSIFLWRFALTSKAAGLASIFCKNTAEFPPHPPSAVFLRGRTEILAATNYVTAQVQLLRYIVILSTSVHVLDSHISFSGLPPNLLDLAIFLYTSSEI